jgi:hypothetical protein
MILYKMPKKEIDYSKTIIYKIVCNDLNITECYVGHTTNFVKRKNRHKYDCTNNNSKWYNLKIYQTIRINGDWDNWSMIEVEKYPCNDINEATARERHWYEQLNANLNTCCPGRTRQEWCETNKEKILEQANQYYKSNKEQISEYKNQKFNCECGGKYTQGHKARHLNCQKHKDFMALKTDTIV